MSTRSSTRNLFPPLDNLELTFRRRSGVDPTLLNDFEMVVEGPSDLPVPDLRTMEEICQPSLNVQNSYQFHGLRGDDANNYLDKFLHVTQSIKVNGVTDDALHLYLFLHSLTHHATTWFDHLPRNSINTFEQMAKMFLDTFYNDLTLRHRYTINAAARGTFMKRRPEECYDLIENMNAHHNDWDTSAQQSESSSSITSSFDTKIAALKAEIAEINKNLIRVLQANDAILKNMQTNMTSLTNSNLKHKNMFGQFMKMNTASSLGSGTLPGNTITNLMEELKGITTRSGTAYQGPMIPTTSSSLPPVVERETEATKDTVHPTNKGSTKDVQPLVVQTESPILNFEPVVAHKCGYLKDNCELNFKFLNNLQPKWKQYATMMRQNKNIIDINIDALYNILKQNKGDVNDAMRLKKKIVVVTYDPLALIAEKIIVNKSKEKVVVSSDYEGSDDKKGEKKDDEKKQDMSKVKCYNYMKEGHFSKDCKKAKVKDYNYYKTKMLLAKKDSDEQVLLAEDQAWMESNIDSDKEINANMKRIEKANQQSKDFENQNKDLQDKYDVLKNQATTFEMYNKELNEQLKVLIEKNDDLLAQTKVLKDQLQVKHVVIDTHVECHEKYAKLEAERYEYMIRYSSYFDNDKQHKKQIADQEVLYDKMSVQLVELDKHTVHMVMPLEDILYNGRKGIDFKNPSYFEKAKDLRPSLYDEKVIGLGYTLMFLTHSDEALEIEKIKRARENKIEFAYDYGSLNASYVNEKIKF
nr:reverse transcriptase domain-containing protein [Tanacetum cinerariifolium]